MNILVVTQYFYPEEFKINDLIKGMVSRGHNVTVLTGKPNYPKGKIYDGYKFWGVTKEYLFGAQVIRVPIIPRGKGNSIRLILNYFSFVLTSCFYVLIHRFAPDKIFVWDTSPILQAYAAILVKKRTGANLSMWVQDLWPESVTATKGVQNELFMKVLRNIVRGIYRQFDILFIQSKKFEESIREKGSFKARYIYAPNWAEDSFLAENVNEGKYASIIPKGFIVMFAGNIGVAQDFENVLEAARLTLDNRNIKWVVVGDGRMRKLAESTAIKKGLKDKVFFLGRYPFNEMPYLFCHADVMLVSLKDEHIFSLTIPSKTQAYMAFGKPIATMINGVGNDVVLEAKCGLVASAGNASQLAENIMLLESASQEELKQMGTNGRIYYNEHFEKDVIVERIINNL